jgi:hypothetical protein
MHQFCAGLQIHRWKKKKGRKKTNNQVKPVLRQKTDLYWFLLFLPHLDDSLRCRPQYPDDADSAVPRWPRRVRFSQRSGRNSRRYVCETRQLATLLFSLFPSSPSPPPNNFVMLCSNMSKNVTGTISSDDGLYCITFCGPRTRSVDRRLRC